MNGHHAGLDERCDYADRVGARHGWIFDLLHNHETRVSSRIRRGKQQIAIRRRIPARLAQHPKPQVIHVTFEIETFFEHCVTRNIENTPSDYASWLAARMQVYRRYHL